MSTVVIESVGFRVRNDEETGLVRHKTRLNTEQIREIPVSHVKQVDISHKPFVLREAVAEGYLRLRPETIERIRKGEVEKGDPLQLAQLGGIIAAKETPRLLPLCHPIRIESVNVEVA
ncbi:MAG: cyclic pyranopterin monophosphate synthase MoaC, partial [Nitrososphaerota archaeon]